MGKMKATRFELEIRRSETAMEIGDSKREPYGWCMHHTRCMAVEYICLVDDCTLSPSRPTLF